MIHIHEPDLDIKEEIAQEIESMDSWQLYQVKRFVRNIKKG